jgi:hypothetical protein
MNNAISLLSNNVPHSAPVDLSQILDTSPSMESLLSGTDNLFMTGGLFALVALAFISMAVLFRGHGGHDAEACFLGVFMAAISGLSFCYGYSYHQQASQGITTMIETLHGDFHVQAVNSDYVQISRVIQKSETRDILGQRVQVPENDYSFTLPIDQAEKLSRAMLASNDTVLRANASRLAAN